MEFVGPLLLILPQLTTNLVGDEVDAGVEVPATFFRSNDGTIHINRDFSCLLGIDPWIAGN